MPCPGLCGWVQLHCVWHSRTVSGPLALCRVVWHCGVHGRCAGCARDITARLPRMPRESLKRLGPLWALVPLEPLGPLEPRSGEMHATTPGHHSCTDTTAAPTSHMQNTDTPMSQGHCLCSATVVPLAAMESAVGAAKQTQPPTNFPPTKQTQPATTHQPHHQNQPNKHTL